MYKVLIVDDDKANIDMLRESPSWEDCGFTIDEEAHGGKEALKRISASYFDLVITDIRMPGMDGLEFLSELKARNIDSCFMIMSTYNDFDYAQQGIRLGVFDYMVKPVEDNALCEALGRVKKHLDEKKLQQSKLIEDNLRFYYPESQEKVLVCLILAGNYGVIEEAENTCLELFKLTNQDIVKTSLLLERVILSVTGEIYNKFPWLGTLEAIVFNRSLTHADCVDDVKLKFTQCLSMMLEIIKKYELHRPDSIVAKVCCYVMKHIEEDINLEDIAKEVHISKNYMGKLFKQKTGSNFTDYVTKVKMEHAKYLLGTGEYKNYEVSEKLGYSSPDYFRCLFKNYTGYTPLEFRKMGIKEYIY